MTYTPILNSEIDPDSPITTGLMFRLRDNPIAIINGDPGAPRATSRIITPGGAAIDGILGNGTTLALPGLFDFDSISLSGVTKAFPWFGVLRADGNSSILASAVNVGRLDVGEYAQADVFGLKRGSISTRGTSSALQNTGGGGAQGNGGNGGSGGTTGGQGGAGFGFVGSTYAFRFMLMKRGLVGGYCPQGSPAIWPTAKGGGCLFLFVHGDLDLTGSTIDASGDDGTDTGNEAQGGAGGGSIFIAATGTITGGTFRAKGGNAGVQNSRGGGGAGGMVQLLAAAYAGTQTFDVTGGTAVSTGVAGDDGTSNKYTATEPQINSLLLR